jgi:hypothetical protein
MLTKSQIAAKLDAEINAALVKLKDLDKESKDYGTLIEHIAQLHKLKCEESPRIKPPSMDTVLVVGANLFGVLWITRYEREHVITAAKAFGSIMKLPR